MFVTVYFAPYMLLAFITYPLQTIIIYFILIIFLACFFFLFLVAFAMCYRVVKITVGLGLITGVIITAYFFFVLYLMATLSSTIGFEDTQKLLFPLLITFIGMFLFKYPYEQLKEIVRQEKLTTD